MIILQALLGFILIGGLIHVLHLVGKTLLIYADEDYNPALAIEDIKERILLYLSYAVSGAVTTSIIVSIFVLCMKVGQVFL